MDTLKLILLIFQMISCVVLTVVIILQNGAEDGLGAIAGGSDTYLGKGKAGTLGIEIVPAAIEDAKKNALRNHVNNADFVAADAGVIMPKLYKQGTRPDVIVMDPIRAGCSEDVLKAAAGMEPKRIVYVSCGPSTFARDAKILAQMGYHLKKVQPVDMFPQTMHVELVALLEKEISRSVGEDKV